MIETAIGSLTFGILGTSTLLLVMLADRTKQQLFNRPNCEPIYAVVGQAAAPMVQPVAFKGKAVKAKRHKGVNSPGKHMTLKQLQQIKDDNYCGVGHEYVAEEVDAAILDVSQSRADKFVNKAVAALTLQNINF